MSGGGVLDLELASSSDNSSSPLEVTGALCSSFPGTPTVGVSLSSSLTGTSGRNFKPGGPFRFFFFFFEDKGEGSTSLGEGTAAGAGSKGSGCVSAASGLAAVTECGGDVRRRVMEAVNIVGDWEGDCDAEEAWAVPTAASSSGALRFRVGFTGCSGGPEWDRDLGAAEDTEGERDGTIAFASDCASCVTLDGPASGAVPASIGSGSKMADPGDFIAVITVTCTSGPSVTGVVVVNVVCVGDFKVDTGCS